MNTTSLIGDIFLCLALICVAVVFIVANVDYLQERDKDESDR